MTASIIAEIQLSSEVVQYISTAAGATKERRRLRQEIQACDDILQQLRDDADASKEGKAWAEKIRALKEPEAPLARFSVAVNLVKAKLTRTRVGSGRQPRLCDGRLKRKKLRRLSTRLSVKKLYCA
jgi:hypothetical protein